MKSKVYFIAIMSIVFMSACSKEKSPSTVKQVSPQSAIPIEDYENTSDPHEEEQPGAKNTEPSRSQLNEAQFDELFRKVERILKSKPGGAWNEQDIEYLNKAADAFDLEILSGLYVQSHTVFDLISLQTELNSSSSNGARRSLAYLQGAFLELYLGNIYSRICSTKRGAQCDAIISERKSDFKKELNKLFDGYKELETELNKLIPTDLNTSGKRSSFYPLKHLTTRNLHQEFYLGFMSHFGKFQHYPLRDFLKEISIEIQKCSDKENSLYAEITVISPGDGPNQEQLNLFKKHKRECLDGLKTKLDAIPLLNDSNTVQDLEQYLNQLNSFK